MIYCKQGVEGMYCPFCGSQIREGSRYCSVCGEAISRHRIEKKRINILHVLLIVFIIFSASITCFAYSLELYYHGDSSDISADSFLVKEIIKSSDMENQYNDSFLIAEEDCFVIFFPEKGDIEAYPYEINDETDDVATVLDPSTSYITIHNDVNYAYVDITASDYSLRSSFRKASLKERLRFLYLYPTFSEILPSFF